VFGVTIWFGSWDVIALRTVTLSTFSTTIQRVGSGSGGKKMGSGAKLRFF